MTSAAAGRARKTASWLAERTDVRGMVRVKLQSDVGRVRFVAKSNTSDPSIRYRGLGALGGAFSSAASRALASVCPGHTHGFLACSHRRRGRGPRALTNYIEETYAAVWAWWEGELSPKLTPAIEAVDVDRLRRGTGRFMISWCCFESSRRREGKDAGWGQRGSGRQGSNPEPTD
jgi:hypothetical protein